MNILDRMRSEWNARAGKDAHFYVAFARENQTEEDFLATAAETMPVFENEFSRLPPGPVSARRALEIGCGPGRLMLPVSRYFGEVHGVDISDEMVALARERLRDIPNASVHKTSGADLAMFPDRHFDFVYSYIVFQHIPSRDIVLDYLREAQRVLKPGGVLCCQLRGIAPPPSEMVKESETWTGCYFSAGEILDFARRQAFPLVALSGLDTQYMWTTFRKPASGIQPYVSGRVVVKAVTAANGPAVLVPARGKDAAISLWIDGMPESASLADFQLRFRDREQAGCYLSSVGESGGCQLNARLPDGLEPGPCEVKLRISGQTVDTAHQVTVQAGDPWSPRVVAVTDGINPASLYRVEAGGAKVVIEDLELPGDVSFAVGGSAVESVVRECRDPITSTWVFAFTLPRGTSRGRQRLNIRLSGRELGPVDLEVL